MSMATSLSSALSGLTAASRAADLVASNVANAMTQGYARRDLQLGSRSLGGVGQGVVVNGVTRNVDLALMNDRRNATADAGDRSTRFAFLSRLETTIGTSDSPTSIGARVAAFDSALIAAASRPESESRLTGVLDAAKALTKQIASAANDVQAAREGADDQIENDVAQLNSALTRVADMNTQIRAFTGAGRDTSALMDQRQQLIDQIAEIIPLREVDRDHGEIALYAPNGTALLEGRPSQFGFTPVGVITADMTLASGALSGLTLNGRSIATNGEYSPLKGGRLSAQFAIRDELAPAAQTQLDALARDLVTRFDDPALDPTRSPGDPGLFTDLGGAFNPANEEGLAQRLSLNASVDPSNGGALWRLRDGLGATTPGPAGQSSLLTALQAALVAPNVPASGGFAGGAFSFSALNAKMISGVAMARLTGETESNFATARADALQAMEMQNGVDTDQEMQKLLLIEQAYSANAKVIQAVDGMIQTMLGI